MVFKEIRDLIFSPVDLIIDDKHIENIVISDFTDLYNDYEVIGIRSDYDKYVIKHQDYDYIESKVVISLKETLSKNEGLDDSYIKQKQKGINIECKE